jgi:hypothetical protein
MFSLCCSEKAVEKVVEPTFVDNLSVRAPSVIPTLRGPQPTPGPVPIPLPSVTPPTPDLTPDEIAKIQAEDIRSVRPGFGLPPKFLSQLIGRTLTREVKAATPVLPCDLNEVTS